MFMHTFDMIDVILYCLFLYLFFACFLGSHFISLIQKKIIISGVAKVLLFVVVVVVVVIGGFESLEEEKKLKFFDTKLKN